MVLPPFNRAAALPPAAINRAARTALAAGLLALALAGCGRNGGLEPPPDPSVQPATSAGEATAPALRRPKRTLIKPSQEPFILDPLL